MIAFFSLVQVLVQKPKQFGELLLLDLAHNLLCLLLSPLL